MRLYDVEKHEYDELPQNESNFRSTKIFSSFSLPTCLSRIMPRFAIFCHAVLTVLFVVPTSFATIASRSSTVYSGVTIGLVSVVNIFHITI